MASDVPGKLSNTNFKTWLQILIVVFQTILVLFGYEIRTAVRTNTISIGVLQLEMATIKANRFTVADGLEVWKELERKANKSETPSDDVRRRLKELEDQARRSRERERESVR